GGRRRHVVTCIHRGAAEVVAVAGVVGGEAALAGGGENERASAGADRRGARGAGVVADGDGAGWRAAAGRVDREREGDRHLLARHRRVGRVHVDLEAGLGG